MTNMVSRNLYPSHIDVKLQRKLGAYIRRYRLCVPPAAITPRSCAVFDLFSRKPKCGYAIG